MEVWTNVQVNQADSIEKISAPSQPGTALPNLVVEGFRIALRYWPFVVWAYALNLVCGLLAGLPFASGLAPLLDHSLAAQKIAGTINLAALAELALHVYRTGLLPAAMHAAIWLNLIQVAELFVLFAGSVVAYVSGEPPQLSVLLRGGVAYFWRFVRAALLAGGSAVVILGLLLGARALLLANVSAIYFERKLFWFSAISGTVVLLVGLLLRLWWDLVEVYVVRNVLAAETRVRYALLPALRLLLRHFFTLCGSFLLAGLSGVCALALCLYAWNRLVPAHQVWLAALLAQLGLFLLLASRFWQRGIETALVLAVYPLVTAVPEPVMLETVTAGKLDAQAIAALPAVKELTLRDLVLKLRTDPLAAPDVLPLPPDLGFDPVLPPLPVDRHAGKFPLGGVEPTKPPPIEEAATPTSSQGPPDPEK